MARPIPLPIVKTCLLKDWDPEGDTLVVIRQARVKEEAERDQLFSQFKIERSPDGVSEVYKLPGIELMATECYLTFEDANILGDQADGQQTLLFRKGMSRLEFRAAFGLLPSELMLEWHRHVLQLNPNWGSPTQQEDETKN